MNVLVIYDSTYGNTEKVAHAMAEGTPHGATVKVMQLGQVKSEDIRQADIVIMGSPTHGGRPTPELQAHIQGLPTSALSGKSVAAFDTRFEMHEQALPLQLLMRLIGFAAPRIARDMKAKGGNPVVQPEGFIVEGKDGPLRKGELARATTWIEQVIAASSRQPTEAQSDHNNVTPDSHNVLTS